MPRQLIIEADGGSRGNPGIAAGGAVVIDGETQQVLASVGVYVGIATNNVAEYNGLLAGLIKAYDIDPGALVHVRMDSKLVVEQMSGRWKIKHEDMKRLALQARDVVATNDSGTVANGAAGGTASAASGHGRARLAGPGATAAHCCTD